MTRYLSLAEFWFLAEQVTGIDAATLIKASRVDLAVAARKVDEAWLATWLRERVTVRG
ncbi:MAG TPA: hypothetical protein VMY16_06825 [Ilumatobacteraceae bacterium]|nr:hypothetical protein [Ilumatobacteraceae bacterium]